MVSVTIDDRAIRDVMARLSRKAINLRNLMKDIADVMHDAVEENFEKQGRPKWQALRPSTIRQRSRKGGWPGSILQDSTRLAASIQVESDSTRAIVGTNVRYARIHQFGGEIQHAARERVLHFTQARKGQRFAKPSKATLGMKVQGKSHKTRIPARPFLQMESSDLRRIMDVTKRYLKTAGGLSD